MIYAYLSVPLWNPSYYNRVASGKYYCMLPFYDHSQLGTTFTAAFLCGICINITSFCYIQIYRYYKRLKKDVRENMNSSLMTANSAKKEDDTESKILWTTILLVGWTFIGI
jgi:hypothetical protein